MSVHVGGPLPVREMHVGTTIVRGLLVDAETRCVHYHGDRDIIAIRFRCCDTFYPCIDCHRALADHGATQWRTDERRTRAILCGACTAVLTIDEGVADDCCPRCGAGFNPRCRLHHHLYFDIDAPSADLERADGL